MILIIPLRFIDYLFDVLVVQLHERRNSTSWTTASKYLYANKYFSSLSTNLSNSDRRMRDEYKCMCDMYNDIPGGILHDNRVEIFTV